MPAPLELMELHVAAGYTQDARGRLLRTNEWDGAEAPRFWLGLTRDGPVWRFRADLPETLCDELAELARLEPAPDDTAHNPRFRAEYLRTLGEHAPVGRCVAGPTYWCEQPFAIEGPVRALTADAVDLLQGGLEAWVADVPHRQPFIVALAEGRAVSVCASVRITETAHAAGVETVRTFRRRGHALRAVAGWADAVIAAGRIALYSTSWDNIASRQVAARLGLTRFGMEFHVS